MNDSVTLKCSCGTHLISVNRYDDEGYPPEYGIQFYADVFVLLQEKQTFLKKLKLIWKIITKGDYFLYEVLASEEQFEEFSKNILKLKK